MLERLPARLGLVDYGQRPTPRRGAGSTCSTSTSTRARRSRGSASPRCSWSRSPRRLSLRRACCCSTSPPPRSPRTRPTALFALLRRLRDEGVAIVFVSHKLEEVLAALRPRDRAARRPQRLRRASRCAGSTQRDLVRLMIGRDEQRAPRGAGRHRPARPALRAARAWRPRSATADIDLTPAPRRDPGPLRPGRRRPQRARQGACSGSCPITAGELRVARPAGPDRHVGEALRRWRIGYVSEDRKRRA